MTGSRVVRLLTLGMAAAFVVAIATAAMGPDSALGAPAQKARAQAKGGNGGGNGGGGGGGKKDGGGSNFKVDVNMIIPLDIRSGHILSGVIKDEPPGGNRPHLRFETGKKKTMIIDFTNAFSAGPHSEECASWAASNFIFSGEDNFVEAGGLASVRTLNSEKWRDLDTTQVPVIAKIIVNEANGPDWIMRFNPEFPVDDSCPECSGSNVNGSDTLRAWRNADLTWTIIADPTGGTSVASTAFVYIAFQAGTNNALCDVSLEWTVSEQ